MSSPGSTRVRQLHGGGLYVSELQRNRLLDAAFALVLEQGYAEMAVRKVTERAGVSTRTFYELFSDREDCFLAAFDHAVEQLTVVARPAYDAEREWTARIRAGLAALLVTLDVEPALRKLVFVEALVAGPRVLERRAQVLAALAGLVDEGRASAKAPVGLPPLAAEGVVGAVFGVIHARLSQPRPASLLELLGPLMATIVLPYRGSAAAARELERPVPALTVRVPRGTDGLLARPLGSVAPVDFRLTIRTQTALAAVAELGEWGTNPNNREVSERMGVADQGQVSRLMTRLQDQGLVENTRGPRGAKTLAKAWRLTSHGQAISDAHRPLQPAQRKTKRGGKLSTKRSRPISQAGPRPASGGARITARTHRVLTAIADLNNGDKLAPPSNVEISEAAGVRDQGQISKLLRRLQTHGLLRNTGGATAGIPNAWHLTPRGEEVINPNYRPHNRGTHPSTTSEEES